MLARSASTGRNVARLDLLAPLASNLSYNFWRTRGLLPVLFAYERRLHGRWSLGVEGLLNGEEPEERRSGAALFGRYYIEPVSWSAAPLTGLYVSPVLSYRVLHTSFGYYYRTAWEPVRSQRGGAGLMFGWQAPLGQWVSSRLVLDVAAGVVGWVRLGADSPDSVSYLFRTESVRRRPGLRPDCRAGLGYRF